MGIRVRRLLLRSCMDDCTIVDRERECVQERGGKKKERKNERDRDSVRGKEEYTK